MNDDIETPEGWEPQGPVFTRLHNGVFAVLERGTPEDLLWCVRIYRDRQSPINSSWYPLQAAVWWANRKLGVGGGLVNTWPGGVHRAMTQREHAEWNEHNSPGTRQTCDKCGAETGRCEEDDLSDDDGVVHCPQCWRDRGAS